MTQESRQARLGVLGHATPVEADIDGAVAALAGLGLSEPDPALRNAVGVALMHSSYLYEHRAVFPGITQGLLDALSSLGLAFLRRLATVAAYQRADSLTAGSLSKDVAHVANALPVWAARQSWVSECAALGKTFGENRPPAKVLAHLLRHIVGVLCIAGEEMVASRLLESLLADVRDGSKIRDPKTTLQKVIAPATAEYAYERQGPDHQAVFRAIVTDRKGNSGTGVGHSKKVAAHNAALDLLQTHFPQALPTSIHGSTRSPAPLALSSPRAHVLAVQKLRSLFALPASATPLLSQALIHGSWAYEHQASIAEYRQQDNQILGFVGAEAAMYEDNLAAALQAAASPPPEFAFRTLDNEAYNEAFVLADVASGLLLGAGQASLGISQEMGATAFQAIIGAIFVATRFPNSVADFWPEGWAQIWSIIAPETPRSADPTTLLQEAASAMRLQTEFEFTRSGPDHRGLYEAVLVLSSEALNVRAQVDGSPDATKTRAKHSASDDVLRVLDDLAQPAPERAVADAHPSEVALARFMLAHQAALISTSPVPLQRWIAKKLFGLHLADSPGHLISWADGADLLLDSRNTMGAPAPRMEEAFRTAIDGASNDNGSVDKYLARTLEMLEQIRTPEELTRGHLSKLAELCNVYRCIGADDPDTTLAAVAEDWRIFYQQRLIIPPVPSVHLTARERAILDAAVTAVLLPGITATMEITGTAPLGLRVVRTTESAQQTTSIADTCAMWSLVSKTTTLYPDDNGILVVISTIKEPIDPGPIAMAAVAALRPVHELYHASVADMLHDLKNQAVAARQSVGQSTANETARLEQQLNARRHLDRAHAMVVQLKAAASLLGPPSNDNINLELGVFLREYGRAAFAWLPNNITISAPGVTHAAYVAIDPRSLTAILDNLVKNAAEAMTSGGSIKLSWAADEYEAIIEVADDGPGLPAAIAQALAAGQRIPSTKPGGSGLGLLGVRSMLRRFGGQLSAASVTTGTAWEITLLIATTLVSEQP